MNSKWKIYVKDRENLRILLNLILLNREAELTIRKNEGLTLIVSDTGNGTEIIEHIRGELGNKVEISTIYITSRENVFLLNRPRFIFDSVFPFFVETSLSLVRGDEIYVKVDRYFTLNPFKRSKLGSKANKVLYRMSLFTPVLLRDYSNRDGMQSLTFEKKNPLILTSLELSSLINGSGNNGLLAL
jgi:hypothetical protein